MLIITRKRGERIMIDLDPAADPEMRAADLFRQGPVEILLMESARGTARIAVVAARSLTVRRAPPRDPLDPA